jgi:hypothetical protein
MTDPDAQLEDSLKPKRFWWVLRREWPVNIWTTWLVRRSLKRDVSVITCGKQAWAFTPDSDFTHSRYQIAFVDSQVRFLVWNFLGRAKEKIRESVTRGRTVKKFCSEVFSRMEERMSRLSTYKLDSWSRGRVKTKAGNIILVWITTSISYNNIFHQKICFAAFRTNNNFGKGFNPFDFLCAMHC